MAGLIRNFFHVCAIALVAPALAFGVQSPRAASSKVLTRNQTTDSNASIRRSATSVIARSTSANARRSKTVVTARPAVARSIKKTAVRSGTQVISNGANLSRAAVANKSGVVRSAINKGKGTGANHLSRAASSRATAVFDDVTKISSDYASCRDAYATCMDQFCAVANDTYRRCYCSDKFSNLRDTSDNIDAALGLLVDFQNNNLNAVNKTAAEVSAMYSSTAGEMAIKKDTSSSQKMLDEIGDILSGKKTKKNMSSGGSSLGVIDFGDLSDIGDVWSSNSSTAFSSRASDGMAGLEGRALYKRASNQCANIVGTNCTGDSMFNLASSAYSIMVTQDCNILEKTVNAKKENLMQTVKKAEQILREARLEEYRAHNSKDVNECLNKVEAVMTEPLVCGQNYEKCLDYTGLYINATTGEPVSHQLFGLNKIAPVLGDIDVIESNPRWNDFLNSKRKFAETALDTCRNLADDVWVEYKRSAMIRIAQMQDAKIEQFKNSCVQVIKECYNTNDGTLEDMTSGVLENSAYDVSAARAITTRNMCYQDVLACAAMYGDADGCEYDSRTRKIVKRTASDKKCGLESLLAYVDSVDTARIAQGCESVLIAKTHEMCDPVSQTTTSRATYIPTLWLGNSSTSDSTASSTTTEKYPAGCKNWQLRKIKEELKNHADDFCPITLAQSDNANVNESQTTLNISIINNAIDSVFERLCMDLGYDSKTCHGNYGNKLTKEDTKNKTPSTKAEKTKKANDEYQEDVVSKQEAGHGMGGFGNTKANVYLDGVLSPEQQAKLLVTGGEDVASQVANIEEDYTNDALYSTKMDLVSQGGMDSAKPIGMEQMTSTMFNNGVANSTNSVLQTYGGH